MGYLWPFHSYHSVIAALELLFMLFVFYSTGTWHRKVASLFPGRENMPPEKCPQIMHKTLRELSLVKRPNVGELIYVNVIFYPASAVRRIAEADGVRSVGPSGGLYRLFVLCPMTTQHLRSNVMSANAIVVHPNLQKFGKTHLAHTHRSYITQRN